MTVGLRTFTATRTTNGTTTLYTCPAGIPYESVTLRYSMSGTPLKGSLLINNVPFGNSGNGSYRSATLSLILAPGDTISLETSSMSVGNSVTCDLFLSGYTVP